MVPTRHSRKQLKLSVTLWSFSKNHFAQSRLPLGRDPLSVVAWVCSTPLPEAAVHLYWSFNNNSVENGGGLSICHMHTLQENQCVSAIGVAVTMKKPGRGPTGRQAPKGRTAAQLISCGHCPSAANGKRSPREGSARKMTRDETCRSHTLSHFFAQTLFTDRSNPEQTSLLRGIIIKKKNKRI